MPCRSAGLAKPTDDPVDIAASRPVEARHALVAELVDALVSGTSG